MATEGQFPKSDGDIWYASEVNYLHNNYLNIKTYNLDVTTTSDNIDLSSIDYKYTLIIKNIGTMDCYIDLSNTATTSSLFLANKTEITLTNTNFDDIAAITATGTTTLSIAVLTGNANKTGYNDSEEILTINATDSSSYVSFTDTTVNKDLFIINSGNYNTYISFTTAAATTDFILQPLETFIISTKLYNIAAICASGETTTISILGVY